MQLKEEGSAAGEEVVRKLDWEMLQGVFVAIPLLQVLLANFR